MSRITELPSALAELMPSGKTPGSCSGTPVYHFYDGAVGDRYRLLPVDRIAVDLLLAAIDAVVGVELLVVYGVALCECDPPVDRGEEVNQ
jgi:hypothetical protein